MDKNLKTATVLALTTAVISGLSNFLNKFALTSIKDPVFFTFVKNSIVAVLLITILIGFKKIKEIKSLNKKQLIRLVAIGLIGGSIPFALFFTGLQQTAALNASLIHKTLFVWVLIFAIPILKEKMHGWQWLGIAAIFSANLVIGGFQGFKYNSGELMILIATIFWGIENIIAKIALKDISFWLVSAGRMAFGSLFLLAILAYQGKSVLTIQSQNWQNWLWILTTSLLLLGYVTTWFASLKRAPATYVSTLLVPATLITNLLSAVFSTGSLNIPQIISAILMAGGSALVILFAKTKNQLAVPENA